MTQVYSSPSDSPSSLSSDTPETSTGPETSGSPRPSESYNNLVVGIAGGVIGGLGALTIVIFLSIFYYRRSRRNSRVVKVTHRTHPQDKSSVSSQRTSDRDRLISVPASGSVVSATLSDYPIIFHGTPFGSLGDILHHLYGGQTPGENRLAPVTVSSGSQWLGSEPTVVESSRSKDEKPPV